MTSTISNFVVGDELGRGSFGSVCKGKHITTGVEVAIKLSTQPGDESVMIEAEIYTLLAGVTGTPKLHEHGLRDGQYFMAMELLGPSLTKVFNVLDFRPTTIAIIAEKIISYLEYVHSRGIVHQDIKPSNILVGREQGTVYLADFGLATVWLDVHAWEDVDEDEFAFVGSPTWASKRAHWGLKQLRRDDMESLGYSLAHFFLGQLPWRFEAKFATSEEDHRQIFKAKQAFIRDEHPHLPYQLVEYLKCCSRGGIRGGSASQAPDYSFLRGLFMELLLSEIDWSFDWTLEWDACSVDFSDVDEYEWDDWDDWDEQDMEIGKV